MMPLKTSHCYSPKEGGFSLIYPCRTCDVPGVESEKQILQLPEEERSE